jgi:hypothetical protein
VVDDLRPSLTFFPSSDPDGDELYYVLRLYRESSLGAVPDGGGQLSPLADPMEPMSFRPASAL